MYCVNNASLLKKIKIHFDNQYDKIFKTMKTQNKIRIPIQRDYLTSKMNVSIIKMQLK